MSGFRFDLAHHSQKSAKKLLYIFEEKGDASFWLVRLKTKVLNMKKIYVHITDLPCSTGCCIMQWHVSILISLRQGPLVIFTLFLNKIEIAEIISYLKYLSERISIPLKHEHRWECNHLNERTHGGSTTYLYTTERSPFLPSINRYFSIHVRLP